MKEIKVQDILNITKGDLIIGNKEEICENFSKDTRTIQKGDIYIGIKGEKFDGNLFWKEALLKGAKGVIVQDVDFTNEEKERYANKIIIKVQNTLEALYKIAKFKRNLYNIPVIAVTGSVGKTSTKDLISSVVQTKYKTLKTEGNNNNNIGLPFTILKLKDHEAMVIEMGMNHFGEISLLTNIAQPTLSVITNIGTSHIGNLGSRENILKAKLEILEGMKLPKVIINNDNDLLHNWYEENKNNLEIHTYGIENESEFLAKDIKSHENSSDFNVKIENKNIEIKVPIGGNHFVYNALCAVAVGKLLQINDSEIQKGILEFKLTKKRMEIRKLESGAILINDSYNASYESMKSSIEYLGNHDGNSRIELYKQCKKIKDIQYSYLIKYKKYQFYLSHYPVCLGNYDMQMSRMWCLHGHTHFKEKFGEVDKNYNVALDAHNCFPIEIEDILLDIQQKWNEIYKNQVKLDKDKNF